MAGEYGRIRTESETKGLTPREILAEVVDGPRALPGVAQLVRRERELRIELTRLGALTLDELIDDLFPDGSDDHTALREAAIVARPGIASVGELYERLRNIATQPEMPEGGEFVRVMSLHKSKGLTSKVVIIAGAVEGLIPFVDDDAPPAEQAEVLAEQRRLFYVALTRCTEVLVISSALQIPLRDARQMGARVVGPGRTVSSRFLAELGPAAPRGVRGDAWARGAPRA